MVGYSFDISAISNKFVRYRALKLFLFYFLSAYVSASIGYVLLEAIMPNGFVWGAFFLMFTYHTQHPFQYIAVVVVTYAIIATVCTVKMSCFASFARRLAIFGIMGVSVIVASVPGGVLWTIHDMQAGYFTTGTRFWNDLLGGALYGGQLGWLIIAFSIPYNLLGLIVGYYITSYGFNIAKHVVSGAPTASYEGS